MRQQRIVLIVAILATFVSSLDGFIVNVALPAIMRDVGGGLATQQWVTDAYLITLGALMLIAGSLSDLFGHKKVLQWGLVGFGITSLLCAAAPNATWLIIGRGLQGIAGALLVPSSLALIMANFNGAAKAKAIGSWTAWTGIAFIIGPLLGGILVDTASWRFIFLVNVLPIVFTLWLMRRIPTDDPKRPNKHLDYLGALLCTVGLGAPVFALIEQPRLGWNNPLIYGGLLFGGAVLALFLWYEAKAKNPMLPLGVFKNHNFSVGNVATLGVYGALGVSSFIVVLFLQQVQHFSALLAGVAMTPITIVMFLLSPRFGALAGKFGPRLFMSAGPLIISVACLWLLHAGAHINYWIDVLPPVLLLGFGLSVTVAPLTAAILGDVDNSVAGVASAINNAVARTASLLAVAAVGALIATQFSTTIDQQLPPQQSVNMQRAVADAKTKSLDVAVPGYLNQTDQKQLSTALTAASVQAFHVGLLAMAAMTAAGGVVSAIGIRNKHALPVA